MKPFSNLARRALPALVLTLVLLFAGSANSADYYWDDGTVTVDGASGGGTGAWTVGAAGWEDGANALNWADANTAILGGTVGTLTLGGAITAAGITVQSSGYTISSAYNLTAGAVTMNSGGSLTYSGSTANSFLPSSLSGSGTLTVNNGARTMNNTTTLNSAGALNFTGALVLRGGTATTTPGTAAGSWFTLAGASLTQAAGTAFALDTGASATDAKDLILGDGFNGGTLSLTSLTGYGSIRNDWGSAASGTRTINVNQSMDTTFNGLVMAHGASGPRIRNVHFVKDGSGSLTLAGGIGEQTASQGTTDPTVTVEVKNGILALKGLNIALGATTISGGTLDVFGGTTISGVLSGSGALLKSTAGNLILSGANTFSGPTTITGGYIVYNSVTSEDGAGSIALNGGKLALGPAFVGGTATFGSLSGNSSSSTIEPYYDVTLGIRGLSVNQTVDGTFAGAIVGTAGARDMSLTKAGPARLTLTGANTYSGNTTISEGTLALGPGGSIANTPVIAVESGAFFDVSAVSFTLGAAQTLKGNGTVNGAVTANGNLAPGNSIGTLSFAGDLTLGNSSTTIMEVDPSLTQNADLISAATITLDGTFTLSQIGGTFLAGQSFNLFDGVLTGAFDGITLPDVSGFSLSWDTTELSSGGSGVLALLPVPEPTATTLVLVGVGGLLLRWRLGR